MLKDTNRYNILTYLEKMIFKTHNIAAMPKLAPSVRLSCIASKSANTRLKATNIITDNTGQIKI